MAAKTRATTVGHALRVTQEGLAQTDVQMKRDPEPIANDARGLSRPREITAQYRLQTIRHQTLGKRPGLLSSAFIERNIQMPLKTALGVPIRLAMAEDVKILR
jgi:hypothetical protein